MIYAFVMVGNRDGYEGEGRRWRKGRGTSHTLQGVEILWRVRVLTSAPFGADRGSSHPTVDGFPDASQTPLRRHKVDDLQCTIFFCLI